MPKHGDINQDTGLVFWAKEQGGGERWLDPAMYLFRKNRALKSAQRNYWKNHEESKKRVRDYAAQNRPMKRRSFKNWTERNRERLREKSLVKNYGMTTLEFGQMSELQNGVCAICEKPETSLMKDGKKRPLCVDHCHKTGEVRKLLCVKCNAGLGQFLDDPQLLKKAADYLLSFKK